MTNPILVLDQTAQRPILASQAVTQHALPPPTLQRRVQHHDYVTTVTLAAEIVIELETETVTATIGWTATASQAKGHAT